MRETPPRERGTLSPDNNDWSGHGNTPTRAGNTRHCRAHPRECWKHARVNGEYQGALLGTSLTEETPPRERGTLATDEEIAAEEGNTPA